MIDVRQSDEAPTGKIPGAINNLLEFKFQEVDREKSYIIVCQSVLEV